jgi:23S rRNA (cytidine1920-2'-O)/16S rRNA (cytidine1409-2'-O)-methyltransferase
VGRQRVGKGGVVRDPAAHADAIASVIAAARELAWQPAGLVASPLTGPAGNHEYLLWLVPPGAGAELPSEGTDWSGRIAALVKDTLAKDRPSKESLAEA